MKQENKIGPLDPVKFAKGALKMTKKGLNIFRHIFDDEGKQTIEPDKIVRLRMVLQTAQKNALRILKEEKSKRKRK